MPAKRRKNIDDRFEVRMSQKDVKTFQAAADQYGISLALWVRLACWKMIAVSELSEDSAGSLSERIEMRIRSSEKERFKKAAEKMSLPLSTWMRSACWSVINKYDGAVELVKLK